MICLTFSMLLNSTDLASISEHFHHICVFYLSEYETEAFKQSQLYINRVLNERPADGETLQILVTSLNLPTDPQAESINDNSASTTNNNSSATSLKSQSPFTIFFINIKNSTSETLSTISINSTGELNKNYFYCPEIISFLLDQYMPYCYIWASFALKGYGVTRMSNGLIENYNKYRKGGHLEQAHPSLYLDDVVEGVEAHVFRYQQEILHHPSVVAAAVAKKAKSNQEEANREAMTNVTDEHLCVDTFYKPGCGLQKPSFQSNVPMYKLEALGALSSGKSEPAPQPKALLNVKPKQVKPTHCDLCNCVVSVSGWPQHKRSAKHKRAELEQIQEENDPSVTVLDETSPELARVDSREVEKYRVLGEPITYDALHRLQSNAWLESDVNTLIFFINFAFSSKIRLAFSSWRRI